MRYLAILLLFLAGCNVVGALAYKTVGPPEVPAKYTLAQEPTLILVENYANPSANPLECEQLGRYVAEQIKTFNLAPLIEADALSRLRDKDPAAYAHMSTPAIGRAVGARQVIYVDLLKSEIESHGGGILKAEAAVRVRVIDVEAGQVCWPLELSEGYPLDFATPLLRSTESQAPAARDQMLRGMAHAIGKLFRAWKPDME